MFGWSEIVNKRGEMWKGLKNLSSKAGVENCFGGVPSRISDFISLVNINYSFQINQPTRCNNFSSLLLGVYVQLSMFQASSRPSSGTQQLQ
jgi:hypothetical protein